LIFGKAVVPDDEQEREEFLLGVLTKYLKLREFPPDQVRWFVPRFSSEPGSTVWAAVLSRGLKHKGNGRLTTPLGWDCSLVVVADAQRVVVMLNTIEDDFRAAGSPRPARCRPKKSRFDRGQRRRRRSPTLRLTSRNAKARIMQSRQEDRDQ